jgi:hypothetical protein
MNMTLETITPDLAKTYLAKNTNNRKLNVHRVRFLASMILQGHWHLTHQGIAFNCDGTLRDGQHRLEAIIEADRPVQMWVARGLQNDAMAYIDQLRPRSAADAITIAGTPISTLTVAIGRCMWAHYVECKWGYAWASAPAACDHETLAKFVAFHAEAIEFSDPPTAKKGLSGSIIRAAIACAWWTSDSERLMAFRDQLQSGVVEDVNTDSAVLRLRDWLMAASIASGGQMQRREVFGRTFTAMVAYLERRPLTKLYWRKDVQFPLPECPELQCVGSIGEKHAAARLIKK